MNLMIHCLGKQKRNIYNPKPVPKTIDNSRKEFIYSLIERATAKTKEKESTREDSSDSLLGKKKKAEAQKEIPKVKKVGFVNHKWTEIFVEDEEESQEIDRNEVKKAIIQMMK